MHVYRHVCIWVCVCTHTHKHTETVLVTCGFCVCEFADLLKCTRNRNTSVRSDLVVTYRHVLSDKTMWALSLAEVGPGQALPSCFSSHTVHKCLFQGLFSAKFFPFFVLFISDDFTVSDGPKPGSEVLSRRLRKKCFRRKCVLYKLPSGVNYSAAVGCEFVLVNRQQLLSPEVSSNRKAHKMGLHIGQMLNSL